MECSLKEGAGKLTTQSTTLQNTQYSLALDLRQEVGTNPEELKHIQAGCLCNHLPI
jgi:osmotically inducible protein OsmC